MGEAEGKVKRTDFGFWMLDVGWWISDVGFRMSDGSTHGDAGARAPALTLGASPGWAARRRG